MIDSCSILCGGKGRRLGEFVKDTPKSFLNFNGEPFLNLLIKHVSSYGIENFYLLAGHKGEVIKEYYEGFNFQNLNIQTIIESEPLGTGGAVRNIVEEHNLKNFLLINGDTYIEANYTRIIQLDSLDFNVNVCGIEVHENTDRYGTILSDGNKCIEFLEKNNQSSSNIIHSGVIVFKDPSYLLNFPTKFSLENDFFPEILSKGALGFIKIECDYFVDIGIPETLGQARINISDSKRKAVFLDRDNTITVDLGYTYKQSDLVVNEKIYEILKLCIEEKYIPIVVSNQSGIERGYYGEEDVWAFHGELQKELRKKKVHLSALYFCPHAPDKENNPLCRCRKPNTELFHKAAKDWNIDLNESIFIGDSLSDKIAAQNANLKKFFYIQELEYEKLKKCF